MIKKNVKLIFVCHSVHLIPKPTVNVICLLKDFIPWTTDADSEM